MSAPSNSRLQRPAGPVKRYRRPFAGTIAAVAAYALLGFFLAPWFIAKNAVEAVRENLGAELRLANVAFNPFVLSLRVEGLELDDPAAKPLARLDELFVNFQLSSLFRRAWTFDEFRIVSPRLNLSRDMEGRLNVARFVTAPAESTVVPHAANDVESALPRLFVFDFAITDGVVQWDDAVPAEPVETRFGPVSIAVSELNTLPERSGEQAVVITTETAGTLSWNGSLQLNPLRSTGHAAIKGSHFPLASAYIRHDVGFDVVDGDADVELDYSIDTRPGGTIAAAIDDFDLAFRNVRVRTFSPASGDGAPPQDREVLSLPSMRLAGGALRWPERRASIESIDIDDAVVNLLRDETGMLNVARGPGATVREQPVAGTTSEGPPAGPAGPAAPEWDLSVARFAVNRLELGLEDRSVEPQADVGLKRLDLTVTGISNAPDATFPTRLALEFRRGGNAVLTGDVTVLPEPILDFDAEVAGATLAAGQPYIDALADMSVDSGALDVAGRLGHSPDEPLAFDGDIELVDFLVTETDRGSRLGSWARFRAEEVAFSAAASTLSISEIALEQPYADIFIAEDGSVNLGRIEKAATADDAEAVDPPAEVARSADEAEAAIAVTIGRVVIADGAADFADQSLPLPFAAAIAELNGDMSTIATASTEPSTVSLEGKVDEFGLVRVTGSVTPLDPALNTDLNVVFENVEMPKFSAYSIPLAGREIASGRLDLDLGYRVAESELVGANNIVLRDFELGEKVEHPGAMSLPLGLAVALLKDPAGKMDIDLPVSGNVDDPEFRYGGLLWKALANLVVKIVASPFALLGNLVGAESSELEYVAFSPGSAALAPPEREKIAKLAEALALRPELALEMSGVVDPEADARAIRTVRFEQLVEERVAAADRNGGDDDTYAERRRDVLEVLFAERGRTDDPELALQAMRTRFTTPATEERAERFDSLAYANELKSTLIAMEPLPRTELDALAAARANDAAAAIIAVDPGLEGRVRTVEAREIDSDPGEGIRMKVVLTAAPGE